MSSPEPAAGMHVAGMFIYPVKSFRGCAVSQAQVDALGLVGDRRFLVVDAADKFITQRVLPRMAQVATALTPDSLVLSTDTSGSITVPRRVPAGEAPLRSVTIWKSEGLQAEDCGDNVAAWLSDFLGQPSRLVRIGDGFHRPVLKPTAVPGDVVAFNDAVPFLVISQATLGELNDRLAARGEDPVPMNRFRPNLVIAGATPGAEDAWPRVKVGDIALRAAGPSIRCVVTTTDQLTGGRHHEPLRTLATYRRDPHDATRVMFGQNFIHETKSGVLRVGDPVVPL